MDTFGYVDPNYIQTFLVYADGVYVGTVEAADVLLAVKLGCEKFFIRNDQNCAVVPVASLAQ